MMITNTTHINLFRMITLRSAVKLECLGMARRGKSAVTIVKDELKLKRTMSKIEVLNALDTHIANLKAG